MILLTVGLVVTAGMLISSTLAWAIWPGDPKVSPRLTVAGIDITSGRFYAVLAVLAGVAVIVGAGLNLRWPPFVALLASATSGYLSVSVILSLPTALAAADNGESPLQAHLAVGAILAAIFSALMVIVSLAGMVRTGPKAERHCSDVDLWTSLTT